MNEHSVDFIVRKIEHFCQGKVAGCPEQWHVAATNIPLRFLLTGGIFSLITCLQGPFQSLMGPSSTSPRPSAVHG
ncbi:MAG: hypothetical protein L5657_09185 [Calditerricola sp.]|nr:hypothetical protein [Calditerricola sp.]